MRSVAPAAVLLLTACGARTELLAPDAGAPDVGLPPIDPTCAMDGSQTPTFPPFVPLVPPDVPSNCANGFELGNATPGSIYTLATNQSAGAAAITLDVDFATYLQPDAVLITGRDADGGAYTLMDSCRLQTWTQGDPTGGLKRPPDVTIRQFRIDVHAGTRLLVIDFGGVVSPMYIQVLGLCDFDVTRFADATFWQAVP